MKVLYMVPYIPFHLGKGAKGPKNLSGNLLRYLVKNHVVDLCIICDKSEIDLAKRIQEELPSINEVYMYARDSGARRWLNMSIWTIRGYPATLGVYSSAQMIQSLKQTHKKYDVVHLDYFYIAPFVKYLTSNACAVLTCHDAYSLLNERAAQSAKSYSIKLGRIIRYRMLKKLETRVYPRFKAVCTVSKVDTSYLKKQIGLNNVTTIPLAVSEKFMQIAETPIVMRKELGAVEILCVLPPSSVSWLLEEARWFVNKGIDILRDRVDPNIKITFWGKSVDVLRSQVPTMDRVEYIDFVENYTEFLLGKEWVYVYLRNVGAGLHSKLLEAMACGIPVVGYSRIMSAFEGKPNNHYYSCTSRDEIIAAITVLCASQEQRKRIGEAAKNLIQKYYSLENLGVKMDEVYRLACDSYSRNTNEGSLSSKSDYR